MPVFGAPELMIILVIIILFFGAGKLPQVGTALGKGIREFRKSTESDDDGEPATKSAGGVQAPHPVAAAEAPKSPPSGGPTYTIRSGDTLESVARHHGVTVEALMDVNGYSQRDRVLHPGDRLQIPRTTSNAS